MPPCYPASMSYESSYESVSDFSFKVRVRVLVRVRVRDRDSYLE